MQVDTASINADVDVDTVLLLASLSRPLITNFLTGFSLRDAVDYLRLGKSALADDIILSVIEWHRLDDPTHH